MSVVSIPVNKAHICKATVEILHSTGAERWSASKQSPTQTFQSQKDDLLVELTEDQSHIYS